MDRKCNSYSIYLFIYFYLIYLIYFELIMKILQIIFIKIININQVVYNISIIKTKYLIICFIAFFLYIDHEIIYVSNF